MPLNNKDWDCETKECDINGKIDFLLKNIEEAIENNFENLVDRKSEKKRRVPKYMKKRFSKPNVKRN